MKNPINMEIEDKISTIRELISKAEANDDYPNKAMLPEGMSKEEFIQNAKAIIENATKWIQPNQMENLQKEEYAESYAYIQSLLDGVLTKFPEYVPIESIRRM